MVFIPTYLYIKQHTITGKLYFGKTTSNPETYLGSGKHWKSHIKKHGRERVVTLWYQLYDNVFDIVSDALSMSIKLDIINSKSWLNMKIENGLDGGSMGGKSHPLRGRKFTKEHREKIASARLGKKHSQETKEHLSKRLKGKTREELYGKERAKILSDEQSKRNSGEGNPMYGKTYSEESIKVISEQHIKYYDVVTPSGEILIGVTTKQLVDVIGVCYYYISSKFSKMEPIREYQPIKCYRKGALTNCTGNSSWM